MSVSAYAGSGSVSSVLGFALDSLALRQRTIADNIANLETPGFRASAVDFESTLRAAVAAEGSTVDVLAGQSPGLVASQAPVGANGNNVDLGAETLAAVQSQFQYQLLSRAVTDRFELIRTAAGAY
ncbi:flagellar basal body rod protein FlgB [Nocardioides sp.]|uniref:flagellar basal body rod protein FlgB n=1 Tax=Nocardioides sp. TaxID=35761 RepID=UPI002B26BE32|nr:flagellar basal body rod protein FlgB [Nocardioides sp.]